MRFAIAGCDQYLAAFDTFVRAGWKLEKLFLPVSSGDMTNQRAVAAYAERNDAAIQLSRLGERDLSELHETGCEALVAAGYSWKIPDWEPYLKYAVNFHPSPLPEGRGPEPTARAILEKRTHWAVTCHRISPAFDSGHILASEFFLLQPDECRESLDLKVQMAAQVLANRVATRFTELWEQAKPQENGTYWPRAKIDEHYIDFKLPVENIMRHIRAYGPGDSIAKIGSGLFIVKRAVGWLARHNISPGTIVYSLNRTMVIAAPDGYVGLTESEGPLPEALLNKVRRPRQPFT